MKSANTVPKWAQHVVFWSAVFCLFGSAAVGWFFASHHLSVLSWGAGVWVATQGLLNIGDVALDDDGLKPAWEAVTKPVAGLVGISVFGYAAGAAGKETNASLLIGVLVLLGLLFLSAKVVQRQGGAPATTNATSQS